MCQQILAWCVRYVGGCPKPITVCIYVFICWNEPNLTFQLYYPLLQFSWPNMVPFEQFLPSCSYIVINIHYIYMYTCYFFRFIYIRCEYIYILYRYDWCIYIYTIPSPKAKHRQIWRCGPLKKDVVSYFDNPLNCYVYQGVNTTVCFHQLCLRMCFHQLSLIDTFSSLSATEVRDRSEDGSVGFFCSPNMYPIYK